MQLNLLTTHSVKSRIHLSSFLSPGKYYLIETLEVEDIFWSISKHFLRRWHPLQPGWNVRGMSFAIKVILALSSQALLKGPIQKHFPSWFAIYSLLQLLNVRVMIFLQANANT